MEKKDRQFGFVKGNPYDLSQSTLGVRGRDEGRKDSPSENAAARRSSYNLEKLPSAHVVKRIKLR
jgi:hypothetical protein